MKQSNRPRLHPLMAAAAISVIAVSAAGVGALTGVLPRTSASSAVLGTAPSTAPAVDAASAAAPTQAGTPLPPVPAASAPVRAAATPAPKRRAPAVVRTRAPVEERQFDEPTVVPDYGPMPSAQTLPPQAAAPNVGTVEAVREIVQPGEGTGLGAIAGGVLGGVIGNQFGGGSGKKILTVAGAAGGAYAGHQVEKRARGTKRWEVTVRMDSGALRTLSSDTEPLWRAGDRVRVVDGRLVSA